MSDRESRPLLRRGRCGFVLAAVLGVLSPTAAEAAPDPAPPPSSPRALPDYDGRPPAGTTAGEGLLWVPRIVLFPVHVVTEFGLRRPLGFLTVAAERGKWIETLTDIFTFGPDHNIGIVPTALLDFGFRPSVGIYGFYDNFLAKNNGLRLHAAFGGTDWLRLTVADRIAIDKKSFLQIRGEGSHRPDFVFYGVGSDARREDRARYGADWVDGTIAVHASLPVGFTADSYAGVKTVSFRDSHFGDDPSVRERARSGAYALPEAFDAGYTGVRSGLRLAFDTRSPRPAPGSGVRIEGLAEYGANVREPRVASWIKYGGTVGGFVDVTGHNHVLSLSATALFVDPHADQPIPFTELVRLGGTSPMVGFREGRLLGRSAAVATMEYRYPIWAFLDASAQVAVGNVFDEHLAGLEPSNLRLAFAFGVRMIGERDHAFSLLVGSGTETFAHGATLNEARILIGATNGF